MFKYLLLLIPFACFGQDSLYTELPGALAKGSAIEIGQSFTVSKHGTIRYLRIYKAYASDTSTYTVKVYSGTTEIFRTRVKFGAKNGWQRIPVNIELSPGFNYTVSYYTHQGWYAYTNNLFAAARTRGDITALAGSGKYKSGEGLPGLIYSNRGYFIDVVFSGDIPHSPLIVNAGKDSTYTLSIKDTVKLKGFVSGDGVTFEWDKIDSLSTAAGDTMWNSSTLVPGITGLTEGVHTYQLTGRDRWGNVSRHNVEITILGNPKDVIFELLRDGTWRAVGKYMIIKIE